MTNVLIHEQKSIDNNPSDSDSSRGRSKNETGRRTVRECYIQCLNSYPRYQLSGQGIKANALFHHLKNPISKKSLNVVLEKSRLELDGLSEQHIYDKVEYAKNEYLK